MDRLKKTIEYGLYLLTFLLPVQTRLILKETGLEYTTISLYGTDILLLAVLSLYLVYKFKTQNAKLKTATQNFPPEADPPRAEKLKNSIQYTVYCILFLSLISIFFAFDNLLAIQAFLRLLSGIGLFWIVVSAEYDKLKLTFSFLAGIFLQACLAIWQFLSQSTFASKWLGIASHNASALMGESVIEAGIERWLRAYGGFDHPNVLAGVLVAAILITIYLFVNKASDKNQERDFRFQISDYKFVFYFLILIFSLALFFTFSRAAWLSLLLGLITFGIVFIYKKEFRQGKNFLKIILSLALLFAILGGAYRDLIDARVSVNGRLEVKSISERSQYYNDFREVIQKNWLFGVGIGNYSLAVKDIKPSRSIYDYQPVHNAFLLLWTEIGLFGSMAFFTFLLFYFFIFFRSPNQANFAVAVSLMVLMLFDHWLWSLHFGVFFFWFIFGYLYRYLSEPGLWYNDINYVSGEK